MSTNITLEQAADKLRRLDALLPDAGLLDVCPCGNDHVVFVQSMCSACLRETSAHSSACLRCHGTQKVVQGATIIGSIMASLGSFFELIPPWALGVAVVAIVGVGAFWALRSFGIIKRNV